MSTRHITLSRGGKLYGADLRATIGSDRQVALSRVPQCYSFRGWTTFPLSSANSGGTLRIRNMCTNAFIYPCVSHDGSTWTNLGGEYVARLDTYSPTMGHETPIPGGPWGFVPGTTPRTCPGTGTTDLPDEWPWHDVCNECWNFSDCYWFESSATNAPDGVIGTIGAGIMELMQDTDSSRTSRRGVPSIDPFDWNCFSCHVQPGAIVSMSYVAEVYRSQNKATKAYGSVVNVWVDGKISVRIPLMECP